MFTLLSPLAAEVISYRRSLVGLLEERIRLPAQQGSAYLSDIQYPSHSSNNSPKHILCTYIRLTLTRKTRSVRAVSICVLSTSVNSSSRDALT